jgi:hypothetical protein
VLAAFIAQVALQIRTAKVAVAALTLAQEHRMAAMEACTEAGVALVVTMKTTGITLIITETFMP